MQEVVLFNNGLDVPTRQILDSRGAIPSKTAADAKIAIQEMAEYSQKWHNRTSRGRSTETSDGLAVIQAHLNNLGREIKKFGAPFQGGGYRASSPGFYQRNNANPSYQERRQSMEETLSKNQGASIKTLEIQIGQMSKVLQERGFGSLPSSTETNPRDHVKSILTTIEADASSIRRIGSPQYVVSTGQNSTLIKEKDPGSFTLPCYINNVCFNNAFADLGASVSVMPLSTYLNLGLGELAHTKLTVELVDRTVKYRKGIAENVLVRIGKFVFPVDFIILDMPEDTKVPLVLRRPFLSTAHAKIDVFKRKITLRANGRDFGVNRSLDPIFGDYIELNDLNVPLELRRDQIDDFMPTIEECEVIEEFRARNDARMINEIYGYPSDYDHDKKIRISYAYNLKFSCMIVLEDMNDYRDEGMGDVIFGEPFLREVRIKARRFNGMITIYNGDDKVSKDDERNGILYPYQKLKRFYKGALNLGPEFIRDPSMEEWLTRGHTSVHEMEE
ncbi:mitochondrial proton/calcium exchanger protein-like protein isoform X1 [Tanacetum coccineum]